MDIKNNNKKKVKKDVTIIQSLFRGWIVRKKYVKEIKGISKRIYTSKEILSTEKIYSESLNTLVEVW
jgi:hypothetical protein